MEERPASESAQQAPGAGAAPEKPRDDIGASKPSAAPAPQDGYAEAPPAAEERSDGVTAGAPPPPPAMPEPEASGAASGDEWDVVPVYYGTDRARDEANTKRLDYGALRGRRLELGLAMVTVPKVHKVPQIERPWALQIPFTKITIYEEAEDPKTHFTMKEIKALSEADCLRS